MMQANTAEKLDRIQSDKPRLQTKVNTSKEESIIALIGGGQDVREVAKRKKFKDTQGMADYMRKRGYVWSTTEKNYVLQPQELPASPPQKPVVQVEDNSIEVVLRFLAELAQNKDRLLEQPIQPGIIPRYALQGLIVNKGIRINQHLDSLVKDFSLERNIQQKDIIEVALIDFLRKHGYGLEVDAALGL